MREDFYLLNPVPGCSPELAEALINFRENVTESHSTHSRRWSIWSLAGRNLDRSIAQTMAAYGLLKMFDKETFSSSRNRTH